MKLLLASALMLILLTASPINSGTCRENDVCIFVNKNARTVDFFVENSKALDVTMTIDVIRENLSPDRELPYTATYPANSRTYAFTLEVDDPAARWEYRYLWAWNRGSQNAHHNDNYVYRLPFDSGRAVKVVQGYNGAYSHFDDDQYTVDFGVPVGTGVLAARDGIVVGIKQNSDEGGPDRSMVEKGNYVIIKHNDATIAEYFHLQHNGVVVKEGQLVNSGDLIGYSGNTGFSASPHLHFGVYKSIDGSSRMSIPVRFSTTRGIIDNPVEGFHYIAH